MNYLVLIEFFVLTLFFSFLALRKSFSRKKRIFFLFFILILIPFFELGSYGAEIFSGEVFVILNVLFYIFYLLFFYNVGGNRK